MLSNPPQSFELTERHSISVSLDKKTGNCDVVIMDSIRSKNLQKSLPISEYNRLVDFISHHNHDHALAMIDKSF